MNMATQRTLVLSSLMSVLLPGLWIGFTDPIRGKVDFDSVVSTTMFFAIAMGWSGLLLGTPLLILFYKLKAIRWWSTLLSGCCVGFVMACVFAGTLDVDAPMLRQFVLLGASSGLVFWLFWRIGHRVFGP